MLDSFIQVDVEVIKNNDRNWHEEKDCNQKLWIRENDNRWEYQDQGEIRYSQMVWIPVMREIFATNFLEGKLEVSTKIWNAHLI